MSDGKEVEGITVMLHDDSTIQVLPEPKGFDPNASLRREDIASILVMMRNGSFCRIDPEDDSSTGVVFGIPVAASSAEREQTEDSSESEEDEDYTSSDADHDRIWRDYLDSLEEDDQDSVMDFTGDSC